MRAAWLLLLTALAACGPRGNEGDTQSEATESRTVLAAVKTISPQVGELRSSRSVAVVLEPVRRSEVAAGAAGRVVGVVVKEGSRVQAGQAVIELDGEPARLQLRQAEASLGQARVNLERATRSAQESLAGLRLQLSSARTNAEIAQKRLVEGRQLLTAGAIAAVELRSLEAAVAQTQAGQQNAQDALARAERAQQEELALLRLQIEQATVGLQNANRAVRESVVRAPYAGVVVDVYLSEGEFAGAGVRSFALADTSTLLARFRLPPEEASLLQVGSTLQLLSGGSTYPAELLRSAGLPGVDRLVELTASVSGSQLPPGLSANLRYSLKLATGFLLPSGALQNIDGQSKVFLAQDGQAKAVVVEVRAQSGDQAAVGGLSRQSQVIFPVPPGLEDGDAIEVIP